MVKKLVIIRTASIMCIKIKEKIVMMTRGIR